MKSASASDEPLIAVFIDFENLAIGVRGMKTGQFQIQLVLKRVSSNGVPPLTRFKAPATRRRPLTS